MKKQKREIIKWALYSLVLLICYTIQSAPRFLQIYGAKPMLIISLAICVAMFEGEFAGSLFGVVCGLFMDLYLSLIHILFMHAFDLHVEDRIRIQHLAGMLAQVLCKQDLIVVFDLIQMAEDPCVVLILEEFRHSPWHPIDILRDDGLEIAIEVLVGLVEPAAVCDAVGHVFELLWR